MSLQTDINEIIAPYKESVSICMYHTDKPIYGFQEHKQMPAASLIKLAILAAQFEHHEDLNRSISTFRTPVVGGAGVLKQLKQSDWTISDILGLMISVSDNYAANVMIDHLSKASVNQWLIKNEYQETKLQRRLMDTDAQAAGNENLISAFDALRLFRQLMQNYPQTRKWFLNQQFRGKLPLMMDETATDVKIYNKTGEGPLIDHDVARFSKNGNFFDVAVLTWGIPDRLAVIAIMAKIGRLIYRSL
ncbi:beta-lactamase class A [Secundilactobacillus pentosiphilus]|uniref:Beta-lactamase class A n=1 Tax=Secundilactobacillus pentosiphilus TaxID=1714682 RepID=A0A1Z5IPF4_9LACO|nr:serine hydrolase [Secundilactobacillus pentosiphilus]GAX03576.1 beta-lactamase class A [Secundilactobacillus pentosiphilus]